MSDLPLKSILIKIEASTHKKLMQVKVDTGLTMNEFVNLAILNYLDNSKTNEISKNIISLVDEQTILINELLKQNKLLKKEIEKF